MTRRDDRASRRASHHHASALASDGSDASAAYSRRVSRKSARGVIWKSWRAGSANRRKQSPRRDRLAGMSCMHTQVVACARDATAFLTRPLGCDSSGGRTALAGWLRDIYSYSETGARGAPRPSHASPAGMAMRNTTSSARTGSVAGRGKGYLSYSYASSVMAIYLSRSL